MEVVTLDQEIRDEEETNRKKIKAYREYVGSDIKNIPGTLLCDRQAKHDASANIITKLKMSHPDIEDIPQAPHESIPTSNAIRDLIDLCIQQDHPLPSFQIVQQAGPPEAPEFTAECRVARIKRYATASTKKAAKRLAAREIIRIIRNFSVDDTQMEVVTLDQEIRDEEETNRKKIKAYREYVGSDIKNIPGTLLCDRHNYFRKMDFDIKKRARNILNDSTIISNREKVHQLLNELKTKYKVQTIPAKNTGTMVFIELLCDFDVVFAGTEDDIYEHILDYFSDML